MKNMKEWDNPADIINNGRTCEDISTDSYDGVFEFFFSLVLLFLPHLLMKKKKKRMRKKRMRNLRNLK